MFLFILITYPYKTHAHLWSDDCKDLGKDHMTNESKEDVIPERGEPHHPLEIRYILQGMKMH